jgi:molybdopterin-guanine dinucleotide biosynthesis protein
MSRISKNIMLVSGSGRNVGKTSFIRRVIKQNANRKLVAVKITPHFHEPTPGLSPILVTDNYRIFKETDLTSGKDSSLFLQAGAEKVFYIQSTDEFLESAFSIITDYISSDQPIIVESAALRKFIVPELYLFIQKNYEEVKPSALEMQKLADVMVYSDSGQFSIDPTSFVFDQIWKIKQDDNN